MEFNVGQRVIRKSNEQPGFVHDKSRRKVPMIEVKWEDSGLKQWLPAEEFRLWDKSEIPPPTKPTYRGRTTPEYINRIRSSKQCKDERDHRYKKLTPELLEKLAAEWASVGKKKQKRKNQVKKHNAKWIRKENFDVQYKTALQRDERRTPNMPQDARNLRSPS